MTSLIKQTCKCIEQEHVTGGAVFLLIVAAYLSILFGELQITLLSIASIMLVISLRAVSDNLFHAGLFAYIISGSVLGGVVFNLFGTFSWWLPTVASVAVSGIALLIATPFADSVASKYKAIVRIQGVSSVISFLKRHVPSRQEQGAAAKQEQVA